MDTNLRAARALVWACSIASILIIGIGTAQEDIGLRAIIFTVALIPAGPAILLGSVIHDHTTGDTNGTRR